jgi:hypothetical protein
MTAFTDSSGRRAVEGACGIGVSSWGGVRLTDPLEQHLDNSMIEQLSVGDLRDVAPAVWA